MTSDCKSSSSGLSDSKPSERDRIKLLERRRRLWVSSVFFPGSIGVLLWIWGIDVGDIYFLGIDIQRHLVLSIAVFLMAISALCVFMFYLETGFKRETGYELGRNGGESDFGINQATKNLDISAELVAFREDLSNTKAELKRALDISSVIGELDKKALVEELKGQFKKETSTVILDEMKSELERHQKIHLKSSRDRDIALWFEESKHRMGQELASLGFRGNLNLALGALTTVAGLGLLGWSVFQEVSLSNDLWSMASHFLPRLTLVVMIELFSYFFLSLYKTSLQEIKYLQNELTNVEAKQIALRAALDMSDSSTVSNIVLSLSVTERNHVLSKDQTTVELEKAKIDKDARGDMAKYLAELLNKKT